jgi:hypothetical protein
LLEACGAVPLMVVGKEVEEEEEGFLLQFGYTLVEGAR